MLAGFEIAMDDALLVRRFERFGDLLRDRQRLIEGYRTLRDALGERRPLDQLHHQRADAVRLLDAVDLRRCCGWFSDASTCASRSKRARRSASLAKISGQDFDCDVAAQPDVASAIDFAHPAGAKWTGDLVRAEACAHRKGHGMRGL